MTCDCQAVLATHAELPCQFMDSVMSKGNSRGGNSALQDHSRAARSPLGAPSWAAELGLGAGTVAAGAEADDNCKCQ